MSFFSWFRTSNQSACSKAGKSAREQRCFRPKVETLEDRVVPAPLIGHGAANDHTILFLASSLDPNTAPTYLSGSYTTEVKEAQNRGFSVEIDSNADWAAKTPAQFATYRAIVIGDFHDQGFQTSPLSAAVANVNTWAGAVSGNVFLVGGDAELHARPGNGAQLVIQDGVDFAAGRPGHTGLYFAFGDFSYSNTEIATILNGLAPGFNVTSQGGSYNVVAPNTGLPDLTTNALNNRFNHHKGLTSIPSSFSVFATNRNDATTDEIVIRQNLDLTPQFKTTPNFFNRNGTGFVNFQNTGADIVGDFTISFSDPGVTFRSLTATSGEKTSGQSYIIIHGGLKKGQSVGIYMQFTYDKSSQSIDAIRKHLQINVSGLLSQPAPVPS